MINSPEELLKLKIHERIEVVDGVSVLRIPTGFIYIIKETCGSTESLENPFGVTSQFIPYDATAEEMRRKLYEKFNEVMQEGLFDSNTSDFLRKLQ